jgi:putative transposase
MRSALAKTSREWFRVIHFSVQSDRVHLIVEADDEIALSRGLAGLSIRLARVINRAAGREGNVFGERYHARELATPRETRDAIVYVLLNRRKHAAKIERASARAIPVGIDPMSSGYWFDGWKVPPAAHAPPGWLATDVVPVRPARTWLALKGWRRHGLIEDDERPKLE